MNSNVYKKPFMTTGPGPRNPPRPRASPTLAELSFPAMELYAMPAATGALLEDTAVNIDEWLAGEVEAVLATQEGTAFVTRRTASDKSHGFSQRHQRLRKAHGHGAISVQGLHRRKPAGARASSFLWWKRKRHPDVAATVMPLRSAISCAAT